MSQLGTLAARVRAMGEERRQTWVPNVSSFWFGLYQEWERQHGRPVPQERLNFCQYGRVVVLKMPWQKSRKPLLWAIGAYGVGTATMLLVALWYYALVGYAFAGLAVLGYVMFCVLTASEMLYELNPSFFDHPRWEWLGKRSACFRAAALFLASPVLALLAGVALVIVPALAVLALLHDDHDAYRRFFTARISDSPWLSWIRPWLIIPVGLALGSIWSSVVATIAFYLLLGVVMGGAFWILATVGHYLVKRSHERRLKREQTAHEARVEALLKDLFVFLNPEAADPQRYALWRKRYVDTYVQKYGKTPDASSFEELFRQTPQGFSLQYPQYAPVEVTPKPRLRRTTAVLRPVGEMLQLIWALILAAKWGICPYVELPKQQ